jgi:hypothetical protein
MPVGIIVAERSLNVAPDPRKNFRARDRRGAWEPETFAIFNCIISDRTLCPAIVASFGSTALDAAQLARKRLASQPDPEIFQRTVAERRGDCRGFLGEAP